MYIVDIEKFTFLQRDFLVPIYMARGCFNGRDLHPIITIEDKIYVLSHTKQKGKRLNIKIRIYDIEGEFITGIKSFNSHLTGNQYLTLPLFKPNKIYSNISGYIMIKPYLYDLGLTVKKFKLIKTV
jgi:hypothetical protein